MKIEDFKNITLPMEEKKHQMNIFQQQERVSFMRVTLQNIIDVPIVLFFRTIFTAILFKYFTRNTPDGVAKAMQTAGMYGNDKEAMQIFIDNNFHMYAIYSFLIAFVLGSFYYTLLIIFCKNGTLGMRVAKILPQSSGKITFIQSTSWYFLKILYPMFTMLALVIFLLKGVNFWCIFFAVVGIAFSSSFTMVFGVNALYEKLSGVKLINKK